jgi:hypothetical protein
MQHNPLEVGLRAVHQEPATASRDARLEEYLDRVTARLPREMSPEARAEERRELALHLDALVAAHLELGRDDETAVLAALREFGCADRLARQMARAIRRGIHRTLRTSRLLLVSAGLFYCGFSAYLLEGFPSIELGPAIAQRAGGFCLDLLIPAIAGYVWGRHRPVGLRWWGQVVLPLLLLSAVLPVTLEMPHEAVLLLFAHGFLLMKWAMATCGMAGLTVTFGLLWERWSGRAAPFGELPSA